MECVKEKIKKYIDDNLIVSDDEAVFQDDDNIFAKGFVNSLFAMKILNYIEGEFDITVENDDMDISNFNTVNNIVSFVTKKKM